MSNSAIFQRLPLLPALLAGAILAVELAFQAGAHGLAGGPGAIGWRSAAIVRYAFADPLFDSMLTTRHITLDGLKRFFSYALIHHGATHAVFGAVLLLALAKGVAGSFQAWAVAVLILAGTLTGALCYGLALNTRVALIGIYPAVYALIGAWTWSLFMTGQGPRARLAAFRLIGMLAGLQLLFQITVGGSSEWVASLGAFVTGFLLSFVIATDGPARLRAWRDQARQR